MHPLFGSSNSGCTEDRCVVVTPIQHRRESSGLGLVGARGQSVDPIEVSIMWGSEDVITYWIHHVFDGTEKEGRQEGEREGKVSQIASCLSSRHTPRGACEL